jgi:predicted O-methyltransferase YrrM
MKELFSGIYGIWIYLPFSGLSRKWRRFSGKLRGKEGSFLQQISLPTISWRQCTGNRLVKIWEHEQSNGNIRISELAFINLMALNAVDGSNIFEIGTFDGRTALNLAFSSPDSCKILTLDLKPDMNTEYALANGERHMVEKEMSGARIERYRKTNHQITKKMHQLYGDSARFDFTPYYNSCSLVFVDGSHAYDYVLSDTREALKMVKKGGIIIWHDYGIWDGVTKALEEIENKDKLGLKNVGGTSLVYWRND